MSECLVIVGEGQLAELVAERLTVQCPIIRQADLTGHLPDGISLALLLQDAWDPAAQLRAAKIFHAERVPWLQGFAAFGEGIVGPYVRPGNQGCWLCADQRFRMAGSNRLENWRLYRHLMTDGVQHRDSWSSRSALVQLAQFIAVEASGILLDEHASTVQAIRIFNLDTLTCSRHAFLPDPLCPMCGELPEDSPANAVLALQPAPKISADSYRCRSLDELKEGLSSDYLDTRTGFLNGTMRDLVSAFADASVNMPMLNGDEVSSGRTHSYADSANVAILEGLERYCGMAPRGKRTVVHDAYRNIAEHALDPLKVGVHSSEQYVRIGHHLREFDPDHPIDWVWGYSFLEDRPILVPERLAYYSLGCGEGFVFETSNGCALGGNMTEAIMYGILEVVERDSFLLAWYARLPLPRLDMQSITDPEFRLMMDRIETVAGYELHLFDSTMEHGIPSVWAIARNRKDLGINLICAAGAHPDPIRAIKGTLHEISAMLLTLDRKFEADRDTYRQMLDDPYLVKRMEDHSMLYALPEAEERLDFLLAGTRPVRTVQEAFKPWPKHADLTEDLQEMLRRFRQLQMDVIVIDQTTPELRRNDLSCVKVLIPGMLPMTFGYHYTRLKGLDRVLRVPMALGYTDEPLVPEQLNPHPHPFP